MHHSSENLSIQLKTLMLSPRQYRHGRQRMPSNSIMIAHVSRSYRGSPRRPGAKPIVAAQQLSSPQLGREIGSSSSLTNMFKSLEIELTDSMCSKKEGGRAQHDVRLLIADRNESPRYDCFYQWLAKESLKCLSLFCCSGRLNSSLELCRMAYSNTLITVESSSVRLLGHDLKLFVSDCCWPLRKTQ
jgi:hypothetical protein